MYLKFLIVEMMLLLIEYSCSKCLLIIIDIDAREHFTCRTLENFQSEYGWTTFITERAVDEKKMCISIL